MCGTRPKPGDGSLIHLCISTRELLGFRYPPSEALGAFPSALDVEVPFRCPRRIAESHWLNQDDLASPMMAYQSSARCVQEGGLTKRMNFIGPWFYRMV